MRTTLTLDDDVAGKLAELQAETAKSFRVLVNEILRRGLNVSAEARAAGPFKVHARPLKLRAGVSLDNVGELLEQIDGPAHR